MAESNVLARAVVRVVLECHLPSPYGDEWTVQTITKYATREAEELVRYKLAELGFRMVEPPKVTVVMAEKKDG